MKRGVLTAVFLAVGVALTLAAVGATWYATTHIPPGSGLERAALVMADVLLGAGLLVAAVYIAVHVGVYFFAEDSEPQP